MAEPDGLSCDVGGYLVVARRTDSWDAIVAVLIVPRRGPSRLLPSRDARVPEALELQAGGRWTGRPAHRPGAGRVRPGARSRTSPGAARIRDARAGSRVSPDVATAAPRARRQAARQSRRTRVFPGHRTDGCGRGRRPARPDGRRRSSIVAGCPAARPASSRSRPGRCSRDRTGEAPRLARIQRADAVRARRRSRRLFDEEPGARLPGQRHRSPAVPSRRDRSPRRKRPMPPSRSAISASRTGPLTGSPRRHTARCPTTSSSVTTSSASSRSAGPSSTTRSACMRRNN